MQKFNEGKTCSNCISLPKFPRSRSPGEIWGTATCTFNRTVHPDTIKMSHCPEWRDGKAHAESLRKRKMDMIILSLFVVVIILGYLINTQ